jgi:hypothetical protein
MNVRFNGLPFIVKHARHLNGVGIPAVPFNSSLYGGKIIVYGVNLPVPFDTFHKIYKPLFSFS